MKSDSIWIDKSSHHYTYPPLDHNSEIEVAIIGGGICGITAAKYLSDQGMRVAVIEGSKIAESNTGRSTGNLYNMIDIPLRTLKAKYGLEVIRDILRYRQEAVDFIEKNIFEHNIECSFQRVPWVRFSGSPECDEDVTEDFKIAEELGLTPQWLHEKSAHLKPLKGRLGFLIKNQAQFNPFQYVQDLAHTLRRSVSIFEGTRITAIEKEGEGFLLKTPKGSIRAKYVIEATHVPLGFSPLQTVLGPYREYGVAGTIQKNVPEGIHWGYYEKDKVTSIRTFEREGYKYALIIGEPHKVGQGNNQESIDKLIKRGKELSLFTETTHEWGGQHYRPADHLPYIGKSSADNRFLATGFSTDGLVYGTLAAFILSRQIIGEEHPAAKLFNSYRVAPFKSAKNFVKENVNVLKQYFTDYLFNNPKHNLKNGEGVVISHQSHKYAVSKDDEGQLNICSAVCPHMGCIVHWNNAEHTWDCPCHGSRFTDQGQVIEGPSFSPLGRAQTDHSDLGYSDASDIRP